MFKIFLFYFPLYNSLFTSHVSRLTFHTFRSRSSAEYTHGITTSVNSVEVVNPPITASAMGERNAAPSPKPKVNGNNPNIVVRLVMKMGRIRC